MAFFVVKILKRPTQARKNMEPKNYLFHRKMANFHPKISPKPTFKNINFNFEKCKFQKD